ncbi:hypothetical protein PG991_000231 [Apiospora marii]|uniref:RRM domain-containing protein n=1 Tax=Apiospora marii TaxID=335849 RepID=A0ABR1T3X9_9PEZI
MPAQNPFGRPASADLIGRTPQPLARTSSARETGSPGVMSSGSSSDGGASLGARLDGLSISDARTSILSDPAAALPVGMTVADDPFMSHADPANAYNSYEVEHLRPGLSVNSLGTGYSEHSRSRQVYNPHEARQREERGRQTRRRQYDDSGVDAQVFYPASACVFVANLPESMDNTPLQKEIDVKFSEFGTCFVKIRRDKKNMPFAFVQYTNDRDANRARNEGAGITFQGRPCRTEAVRANRTFILRNYVGGTVSLDEARDVLEKHGAIIRLEEISRDVAESHGIDQGVLVEFKNFDPDRDIQASFRHHAIYRVVSHDVHRSRRSHPEAEPDRQSYERRSQVDRRSIFIGNLPEDVDGLDREVRSLAGEIGNVVNVQVIRKEGRPGYGVNVFAFVEYARPEVAAMAADDLVSLIPVV